MRVLLFGGSGMVGQGVLRECLADPTVSEVVSVVRTPTGATHPKLRELPHADFSDFRPLEDAFRGFDACFFCLGVSSAGMKEPEYRRITYDMTLAAAHVLAEVSPNVTFVYVSGAGTDSTEKGRSMWARVKGETENALLRMFPKAVMFRPGFIQPQHGIKSKTRLYRLIYAITGPLYPLLRRMPKWVTTSDRVARAMLAVTRQPPPARILENRDIDRLGALASKALP